MILNPETATEANKKVVIPPKTEAGMAVKAAANFEKMPMTMRKKQAAYPALRLAQRVKAMTPLFWAKVDIGVMVHKPASIPLNPSAKIPPWIRESKSLPSTWRRDTSQVAVISPIASIIRIRYTATMDLLEGSVHLRSGSSPTHWKYQWTIDS